MGMPDSHATIITLRANTLPMWGPIVAPSVYIPTHPLPTGSELSQCPGRVALTHCILLGGETSHGSPRDLPGLNEWQTSSLRAQSATNVFEAEWAKWFASAIRKQYVWGGMGKIIRERNLQPTCLRRNGQHYSRPQSATNVFEAEWAKWFASAICNQGRAMTNRRTHYTFMYIYIYICMYIYIYILHLGVVIWVEHNWTCRPFMILPSFSKKI